MKRIFLDISGAKGLGDSLCATPIIRKLCEAYNQKISLITNYPELFKRNLLIDKCYYPNSLDVKHIRDNHIYHNSFYNIGVKNEFGVEFKSNISDIRQFHAMMLGFQLLDNELSLDYIPDPFEEIPNLPKKYVLIHPAQNWPSRTWSQDKWQTLVETLNKMDIPVVITGKHTSETGFFHIEKNIFNLTPELGLNLTNLTLLSQTWHLIEKSNCFVTMDSGLLHLAGTTDANIIQLGSSINNKFRAPYRNNSQDYKYQYISGSCDLFCASDMSYGVKEWGTIDGVPPLIGCLEHKPEFECHPTTFDVLTSIIKIYNEN